MTPQAIHFISIGGSAMHNLAIALQQQGHTITGSDDEIYEPSRTRLDERGLLPAEMGWFPERIHADLSCVILGMHARADNPELARAQELGIPVYSYPEYIYRQSEHKQRVVIAGSHGKTTITSMIMHVLNYHNRVFDYLVGAQVEGFETMVKLTPNAPLIVIEGDEYGSSPIDPQPKFMHYQPHIALISGIAWDHVNIYPTWEVYVDQFELLADAMPKGGILVFDETDDMLDVVGQKDRDDVAKLPYTAHPHQIRNGQTVLITKDGAEVPVLVFGEHNMKNMAGAMVVCDRIGITEGQFYEAISSFKGAAKRLEKRSETPELVVFRDFAHAPSKVEATTEAVKAQYPDRKLLAAVELHTYSSLNKNFLGQYRHKLASADVPVVYFNTHTLAMKRLEPITPDDVKAAFEQPNIHVFTDTAELEAFLDAQRTQVGVMLLMSSGTFGGITNA
ncbi:peptidoglycan synthetase [Rudanella paleaurantiibacter]|uniref:Peptidoglycan synthetase n=1 Tax=Rudanella paleaurantiibacter TaxID=2614655 RepID=A0A7J5TX69_9BACT|nr:Mur ligase family protein [Rudanella paleaurantiibacter]KAB7729023.1 peptidoglycan synthetase [Rudanella paleaurantiibacter]